MQVSPLVIYSFMNELEKQAAVGQWIARTLPTFVRKAIGTATNWAPKNRLAVTELKDLATKKTLINSPAVTRPGHLWIGKTKAIADIGERSHGPSLFSHPIQWAKGIVGETATNLQEVGAQGFRGYGKNILDRSKYYTRMGKEGTEFAGKNFVYKRTLPGRAAHLGLTTGVGIGGMEMLPKKDAMGNPVSLGKRLKSTAIEGAKWSVLEPVMMAKTLYVDLPRTGIEALK